MESWRQREWLVHRRGFPAVTRSHSQMLAIPAVVSEIIRVNVTARLQTAASRVDILRRSRNRPNQMERWLKLGLLMIS